MDPTEFGSGSAILDPSHAVKESGKYDVWSGGGEVEEDVDSFEVENSDFHKVPVKVSCFLSLTIPSRSQ